MQPRETVRAEPVRESLYKVKPGPSGELVTHEGKKFDIFTYSKSKYGDTHAAREYGFALADKATTQFPELVFSKDRVLVTSSAFKANPTSSNNIAQGFFEKVNYSRYLNGQAPTDKIKIVRPTVIEGDFGKQSKEEREASLRNEPFYIDKALAEGSHLIVIDDVVITGANEQKIEDTVDPLGLLSLYFFYAVEMDARTAKKDPSIENRMNHGFVKNVTDMLKIIDAQKHYTMLQRVTKSILRPINSPEDIHDFLQPRDNEFLYGLYTSAINDGIGKMSTYQPSLEIVERELQERGKLVFGHLIPPEVSSERDILHDITAIRKLKEQQAEGRPLRLAFLDIDDTITGTPEEQTQVRELLRDKGYITIFVTSRSAEMVMSEDAYGKSKHELQRPEPKLAKNDSRRTVAFADSLSVETALYDPDIIISSTGTDILTRQENGSYSQDKIFRKNELRASKEWRNDTLKVLQSIDPAGELFRLSYIESEQKYADGISYVYPHDLRIRVEFTGQDDQAVGRQKAELKTKLQEIAKISPELKDHVNNIRLTDESNPKKGKYASYITPIQGSKAHAVDYAIDQICHQLHIGRSELEVLIAGDSMPDLEMGMNAGEGTHVRFIVPGGARIESLFTEPTTLYAGEEVDLRRSALRATTQRGIFKYGEGDSEREIVLARDAFHQTVAASSIIAFLNQQQTPKVL